MSGSSSTTRIRWVIPGLVLEGRHEYRGRVGGAGTPDASTCDAPGRFGSRYSGCVASVARATAACATLTELALAPAPDLRGPRPGCAPVRKPLAPCHSCFPEPPIDWSMPLRSEW